MKKIFAILLAVLMLLSLCACDVLNDISGGQQPTEPTTAPTTAPTEPVADNNTVARGAWDGCIYSNSYASFDYELPSGWTLKSDEEMADLFGSTVAEMYGESSDTSALITRSIVYDMMTIEDNPGEDGVLDNIIIIYENLTLTGTAGYSATEYLEAMKTGLLGQGNYTDFSEITNTTLGGFDYATITTTALSGDVTMEQCYCIRKIGDHMVEIIMTAGTDTGIIDMLECFR